MAHPKYKDHALLPADAPGGQPHIIDIAADKEDFHLKYARLCDFVATVLHHLEGHPDALKDFFDHKVKSFKFLRVEKPLANFIPDAPLMRGREKLSRMIWRIENKVMVVNYNIHQTQIYWENISQSTLSKVGPDGVWKATWGAQSAMGYLPMADMWKPGKLFPFLSTWHNHRGSPFNLEAAAHIADNFGLASFYDNIWEHFEEAECVVEVVRKTEAELAKDAEEEARAVGDAKAGVKKEEAE